MNGRYMTLCAVLATATLAGCAAHRSVEYRDDLAQAKASVDAAQRNGAAQYGAAELDLARQKLTAAQRALDDKDEQRALDLSQEAKLDADLALAKSENQEQQAALTQLKDSIRTLQDEASRNEQRQTGQL